MERSQITPRGHTYLAFVCVVLLTITLLVAGCTGKDATSPAASPSSSSAASGSGAGVQDGDMVDIEYTGTLVNGSVFDSSKDRGPFQFVVGTGTAITGFDTQIKGMTIGQSKKFTLTPDEAYGEYDPTLIQAMPIGFIPKEENVTIGDTITLFNGENYFPAKIIDLNATNVTFDLNHQLAGQSLTFDVKLVNLTPAAVVEEMMNQSQNENDTFEEPVDGEESVNDTVEMPFEEEMSENQTSDEQAGLNSSVNKTL